MSEKLRGDFRKFMDKNFLGSWDVPETGDLVLTIDHAARDEVQNDRGKEKKLTIHFKEDYKPMICNTTNAKAISAACGTTKVEGWEGKPIGIYKATIQAFGQTQECLRVRDFRPKTEELICEECGSVIVDVDGHSAKKIANQAISKYGKALCWDCAMAKKNAETEAE